MGQIKVVGYIKFWDGTLRLYRTEEAMKFAMQHGEPREIAEFCDYVEIEDVKSCEIQSLTERVEAMEKQLRQQSPWGKI